MLKNGEDHIHIARLLHKIITTFCRQRNARIYAYNARVLRVQRADLRVQRKSHLSGFYPVL